MYHTINNNKLVNYSQYPQNKFDFIFLNSDFKTQAGIVLYYQDYNISFDLLNDKIKELFIGKNIYELYVYILFTGLNDNITLSVNNITDNYTAFSNNNIYLFQNYINSVINSINITCNGNIKHVFVYGRIRN